jgi:phosphomevalonate kinase
LLNCFIQDKIGSGFDISAAIFGSHIFRRLKDTSALTEIVDLIKSGEDPNQLIKSLADSWNYNP